MKPVFCLMAAVAVAGCCENYEGEARRICEAWWAQEATGSLPEPDDDRGYSPPSRSAASLVGIGVCPVA